MNQSLHILLVDDEEIVHETIGDYLRQLGHQVTSAFDGVSALEMLKVSECDPILIDVRMPKLGGLELLEQIQKIRPDVSVVIVTGHGTMEMAIQALRLGAVDFLTKPVKLLELDAILEKAARIRALRADRRRLKETIGFLQASGHPGEAGRQLVGTSRQIEVVREQILLCARANCDTVLISGETGTGKEVVARQVHFHGSSSDSPFIPVSCPAIPESLVESELFGHVKGAFTGAAEDRAGCFELADGGTLFLDEVADLSAAAQAKLLRVLETRMIRRVGGSREMAVNVRVVAATNVPLEELVETGRFRRDLLYRLNAFSIQLAPLRERREDIIPLARQFLADFIALKGLDLEGFSPEAERLVETLPLPGNARELRNLVERAAVIRQHGPICARDLSMGGGFPPAGSSAEPAVQTERDRLLAALEKTKWNRREAARLLEMPYSTLRYKIEKYKLR